MVGLVVIFSAVLAVIVLVEIGLCGLFTRMQQRREHEKFIDDVLKRDRGLD